MKTEEKKVVDVEAMADENLDNFKWDDNESMSFFGQKEETPETELSAKEQEEIKNPPIKKEEKKVEPKKETKKEEKEEEEEEEEVQFFAEEKVDKQEVTSTDAETTTDDKFFNVLAKNLKEKGVFGFVEVPEDTDLTEDEFIQLQDDEVEARVSDTFEGFFEELDDDGKD